MRLRPFPLFALMMSVAFAARAELRYALYDLDNPGAEPETVQVSSEELKGQTYRQPGKMLFVWDSDLGTPYYMGVYEVTKGQAERLGWSSSQGATYPDNAAYAFRGNQFAYDTEAWRNHPSLLIPSPEQWILYAEAPVKPCNLPGGRQASYNDPVPPQEWLDTAEQGTANPHGVVDAYGNVAEFATDGNYHGGYATTTNSKGFNYYNANRQASVTATEVMDDSGGTGESPRQGVRLVYVPPAELTYAAKVTLDGKTVGTQSAKEGASVVLEWPAATAGYRRIARTVTPEGLTFLYDGEETSLFRMPAEEVTLAFAQKAVVTLAMAAEGEGGVAFARKEPPESFDALPANEAYAGETLTLTATPEPSWRVREWRDGAGEVIASAGASAQWEFAIPEGTAPGEALTFTAIFERPTYEVAVTLNGTPVEGWPQRFAEGEGVTVRPPRTEAGYRLSGATASGAEAQPSLTEPTTFAMPANDVTVAYQAAGYVNVVVEGGSATPAQPLIGGTVTLTASAPKYKVFRQWTGAATSAEATFTHTIPATATPGATLTFAATYDTLPRVLVTGGSATVSRGTGEDFGEGHYSEGTVLALSPAPAPEGYAFDRWEATGGTGLSGETFTVTPALRNQTVTLTAVYEVDAGHPIENDRVTRIGVDKDGAGTATATTLGWEADGLETRDLLGNTFAHHTTKMPNQDYAVLGLEEATTTYQTFPLGTGVNTEANKTSSLVLKRIKPTAGTHYASGDTYYVGVFETTVGHFKALGVAMGNASSSSRGDTYPYVIKDSEADTFVNALGDAFGLAATRPSVAQIENITKAGTSADETFKGAGYQVDSSITRAMIVHEGDNVSTACATVGSKLPDPYGFYDLWGNALEWLSDNTGHGGRAGYGGSGASDALTSHPSRFKLSFTDSGWSATGVRGAIRPAVTVPKKVNVTISNAGETFGPLAVLPGQKVRLAPQVRAGHAFTGWTANKSGMTPKEQSDGDWLATVTADVTFTATYEAKQPLTLTYKGCLGPSKALPGQTVTVFAAEPTGGTLLSLEVSPRDAATVDLEKGTVTFAAEAAGAIALTAVYETPKAGYRLRLR